MRTIDWHCDTASAMLYDKNKIGLKKNNLSVDIEKLKKANSIAQFFALFLVLNGDYDPTYEALKMADNFFTELEKNKEFISLAKNYDDILKNDSEGKISALLTLEEGGVIKECPYLLRMFHRLGVRLITLTWNFPNSLGYPNCKEEFMDKGLTPFGKSTVEEMKELNMIVDVSHLSDGGFFDVADIVKGPFVASHSNAREICSARRNLTDPMIRLLAESGGIMGINFEKSFLGGENASISKVSDMVKHIKHIRNIGGIDVISLGTDFDGISRDLEIDNIGEVYLLANALEKEGFSQDDIEKIFYKNSLRVLKDVLK